MRLENTESDELRGKGKKGIIIFIAQALWICRLLYMDFWARGVVVC
jgi:hypothetical protein